MDLRRIEFVPLLRSGDDAKTVDRINFREWSAGEISTEESIMKFRKSNGIENDIDKEEYVKWLNSLGYYRRINSDDTYID